MNEDGQQEEPLVDHARPEGDLAHCEKCGQVIAVSSRFCRSCGARQPVAVPGSPGDETAAHGAGAAAVDAAVPVPAPDALAAAPRPPASQSGTRGADRGTELDGPTILGLALILLGLVLFFKAFGFPPGITTTYHYSVNGTRETTSPGFVEGLIPVLLVFGGGIVLRLHLNVSWREIDSWSYLFRLVADGLRRSGAPREPAQGTTNPARAGESEVSVSADDPDASNSGTSGG